MRANLELTDGLIMAEPMMLALGEFIGRQEAHDVVYDAAQAAATGGEIFSDLLGRAPRVTGHLSQKQIASLLDPTSYTGLCSRMATDQAERARRLSRDLAAG